MDRRTAAALLGVSPTASRPELVRAFRAHAKATHPDAQGTSDAFIEIRRAFELLHADAPAEPASPTNRPPRWFKPASPSTFTRADAPTFRTPARPSRRGRTEREVAGRRFADHLRRQLDLADAKAS